MKLLDRHLILIGFKHVGKSTLAKGLAKKIYRDYVDLDEEILVLFNKHSKGMSCREIVRKFGEKYFRQLETKALINALKYRPSVIALGGGTLLSEENQKLITDHVVIHVTAPRSIVFEKIMIDGWLGEFSCHENPYKLFNRLWSERKKIYKKVSSLTINNNRSIECASKRLYETLVPDRVKG